MPDMTLLEKTKLALRVTVTNYDTDLTALINAAKLDLGIAGVELPSALDAICERAIITARCISRPCPMGSIPA